MSVLREAVAVALCQTYGNEWDESPETGSGFASGDPRLPAKADWRKMAEVAAEIAVEACAKVCDYGIKWEPPLQPPLAGMSRETAYLLAKAIRRMLEKTPGE